LKIIKSIEHLSINHCNKGKLKKLEALALAYHSYLQKVVDYYWENNLIPKKYVTKLSFSTPLSERYKQTCGLQAIAVIKSYWSKIQEKVKQRIYDEIKEGKIIDEEEKFYYFANKYQLWFETEDKTIEIKKKKVSFTIEKNILTHLTELVLLAKEEISKPEIKNLTFSLDEKVAKLEKGEKSFDYFLRLSTLEIGKPILIPIKLHENARRLLTEGELKKIVRLKKRNLRWFASLVIEKEVESLERSCLADEGVTQNSAKERVARNEAITLPRLKDSENRNTNTKVGIDVGVKALLVDSQNNYYGTECYSLLLLNIDKMTEYTRRRQKEEACISKKLKQDFKLPKLRYLKKQAQLSSHRKNEIGRSINECIKKNSDKVFILEDLSLSGESGCTTAFNGKTKSRPVNRILNRSLMGYLKDKLRFRLIDKGIAYEGVQPAYSSQLCFQCGWVSRNNRRNQEHFKCEICGYTNNADLNASLNILGRSQDKELLSITDYKSVKELLKKRFYDAHSVSSWLDLDSFLEMSGDEFREALKRQSATLRLEIV